MDAHKNLKLPIGTVVETKTGVQHTTRALPFKAPAGTVWVSVKGGHRPLLLEDLREPRVVMADCGPEHVDGCGAPA